LHEAIGVNLMIAKRSGTIEADSLTRKFIDFTGGLPEVTLQGHPVSLMEATQHYAKAIVGELGGAEVLLQ